MQQPQRPDGVGFEVEQHVFDRCGQDRFEARRRPRVGNGNVDVPHPLFDERGGEIVEVVSREERLQDELAALSDREIGERGAGWVGRLTDGGDDRRVGTLEEESHNSTADACQTVSRGLLGRGDERRAIQG